MKNKIQSIFRGSVLFGVVCSAMFSATTTAQAQEPPGQQKGVEGGNGTYALTIKDATSESKCQIIYDTGEVQPCPAKSLTLIQVIDLASAVRSGNPYVELTALSNEAYASARSELDLKTGNTTSPATASGKQPLASASVFCGEFAVEFTGVVVSGQDTGYLMNHVRIEKQSSDGVSCDLRRLLDYYQYDGRGIAKWNASWAWSDNGDMYKTDTWENCNSAPTSGTFNNSSYGNAGWRIGHRLSSSDYCWESTVTEYRMIVP